MIDHEHLHRSVGCFEPESQLLLNRSEKRRSGWIGIFGQAQRRLLAWIEAPLQSEVVEARESGSIYHRAVRLQGKEVGKPGYLGFSIDHSRGGAHIKAGLGRFVACTFLQLRSTLTYH